MSPFKREPKPKFKSKATPKIVSVDEQVSIDSQRCAQMMAAAESAMKARNFAQAEDLYSACLPIMEQLYASDSKAMADCLTALGDVYYWQDKYGLALPLYQRVLAMRERMKDSSPAAIVTAYLKNAKANEHLNNVEAAQDMYKRAHDIAQKTLMLGHPILTSVLESYGNFLQDKTSNRGLAEDIKRKAQTSKDTHLDPSLLNSDALDGKVKEKAWKEVPVKKEKDPAIWKNIEPEESNHPLIKALRGLQKHPRMTIAFLTLPITLGLLIVTISATYFLTGGESVQTPIVHEKEVFRTEDAQQTLEVLAGNKMLVKTAGDETQVNYITLSNPWRELEYFFFSSMKNDVVVYKTATGLKDEKGKTFDNGSNPDIVTIMNIERFGSGLHKVNTTTADRLRKGKINGFCAQFSYENPYTKETESPNIFLAEFEQFGRPDQLADYLKRARTFNPEAISKRNIIKFVGPKPTLSQSLIKCIILPGGEQSKATFFITATDRGGAMLRRPQDDANLLLSSIAGGEPEFNKGDSEPSKITTYSRVVVSRVAKQDITTAANLLAWVLVLLPIFAIGYKIFEPRLNRKQYAGKESTFEVYLSYIYIIALVAYICFFSAVVLFVLGL